MTRTFVHDDDHAVVRLEPGVAEQMAGAQIDRVIETAKRYPRSLTRFRENAIALATLDEETAASCTYALPRADKTLTGASVRFAEIIASCYQNLWTQVSPIGEDARFVTVRAVAWDVENNLCLAYDVRRRITKSNGQRFNDDMIGVTTAAASSIAFRNVVLRVVPEATTRHILEAAQRVIRGEEQTKGARLDKMLAYFASMGVDAGRVFAAMKVRGREDITLDHLIELRGYATSIKSEGASIDALFPMPVKESDAAKPASRAEALAQQIRESAAVAAPESKAEPEATNEPNPDAGPDAGDTAKAQAEQPKPAKPTTGPDKPPDDFLASIGEDEARLNDRLNAARGRKR